MLSADEDSSILTYLFGLIVLVMAGVGLSLLIDKRSEFSRGAGAIQQEIKLADEQIAELTVTYNEAWQQLETCEPKLQLCSQTLQKISATSEIQQKQKINLQYLREELNVAIVSLKQDYSQFLNNYQRKMRAAAIGEKLGNLVVRGGRVYTQATISRVTDAGLEIRHEHGVVGLQGPDLSTALQERFQWDDEKRLTRLDQGTKVRERDIENALTDNTTAPPETRPVTQTVTLPASVEQLPAKSADKDMVKLNALRTQVTNWKRKIRALGTEKAQADHQASNGNRHSVPGSLETWESKVGRLGRDLAKARKNLELTKAKLAEIAPTDLLLQEDENERLFQ